MQRSPEDIRKLSVLLDSKYGAGPFRFGWDGLLGLIPGIGDFLTNSASLYIIIRAATLGCPPSVLLRMGGNMFIDNIVDFVPVLGNIFDFFWRSNTKNLVLIEDYLQDPRRTVRSSRVVVWLTVFVLIALSVLLMIAAFLFVKWLFGLLPALFQTTGWDA